MHRPFLLVTLFTLAAVSTAVGAAPCRVEVVEAGSGWPVPLVILETTGRLRFVSDNAGLVAFDEPELFGREVYFRVESPGYEVPADGFGYRGVRLRPEAGKTLRVEVRRTSVAKRLGRLTGAGLFAESRKLGERVELGETGVVGCDSIQFAMHAGRPFWMWGDTTLPHYPLGVFHMSAARTKVRPLSKPEPPIAVAFEHYRDDRGRPRGVARMPGAGPTWLGGVVSLPDAAGKPRLVATYSKIKPPLEEYERGLCVWNDEAERFERLKVLWSKTAEAPKPPASPKGHPAFWTDAEGDRWVLFGDPLPRLRCPATYEAWQDASTWETLEPQRRLKSADGERDVQPHSGSIAWHPWRKRWVTVFMEKFGQPSAFGELWYAEAEAPTGPWGPAVKVLSHANYTFYNPRIHGEWFSEDSPVLTFEGTYTTLFANKARPTPRWDYNQVLYRLDLDAKGLSGARLEAGSKSETNSKPET